MDALPIDVALDVGERVAASLSQPVMFLSIHSQSCGPTDIVLGIHKTALPQPSWRGTPGPTDAKRQPEEKDNERFFEHRSLRSEGTSAGTNRSGIVLRHGARACRSRDQLAGGARDVGITLGNR